jgi:hypothetical protein
LENFIPNPASIPIALNLGLIDDNTAIEELFVVRNNEPLSLDKDIVTDVYNFLRSEEGRHYFTQKLYSFSGIIYNDIDRDGYIDSYAVFVSGEIKQFVFDKNQNGINDIDVSIMNGAPHHARVRLAGQDTYAYLYWEAYPSVEYVIVGNPSQNDNETFRFAPADFMYSPVSFVSIGGSRTARGLLYPVPSDFYMELTRRTLISYCSMLTRPSLEFENALEIIYMNRGVLLQVIETLDDMQISVTEFERGLPVVQYVDLDFDGRMETIRRFRRPSQDYVWQDMFDYRRLLASSESDWSGDGRFKTMEVYLPDGSIVYYFDMDGSGEWTHSETGNR